MIHLDEMLLVITGMIMTYWYIVGTCTCLFYILQGSNGSDGSLGPPGASGPPVSWPCNSLCRNCCWHHNCFIPYLHKIRHVNVVPHISEV